ncbi:MULTISPECIES: Crp/Fnr family transcriptional regulator [Pedobacter]|uniref:Crp/Fnr family transcriptional regulator n=1 Tax=Pedobacter TaxID=84567 RepID=UPI00120EC7AC|nr:MULTISPECIES: Crp/Fnr family transcriptional regulator [Pedobacter]RZL36817.1 MAG: Crp/Fnr family transcriptional regulator [Pedobacter sp.]
MSHVTDEGERLIKFLNSLHPLSKKVIALARKETYKIIAKKNEFISCKNSNNEDCVFIILKGVVRGFIIDDGKDITTVITNENSIVGQIRNPSTAKPIYEEKFQAIENSELLVLRYSFIDTLYRKYPNMNILARKLLALHFNLLQERSILCRIPSAEVRYNKFRIGNPTLKNRVPIKFLATYLGMRLETLSRIRKKEKLESAA